MNGGKTMKSIILISLLVLLGACGSQEPEAAGTVPDSTAVSEAPVTEEYSLPEADVYLTVTDSIGVEIGDSNFVFGAIAGGLFTPGGNIAVLDMQKMRVSIFSPEGEFLTSVGRQGSGPGEFLMPAGFTFLPQGDLIVSDAMGGKLVRFDSLYAYVGDVAGFFPSPPSTLAGVGPDAIVGMKPDFLQDETGMYMGFTVARWEWGQVEPAIVYYSDMKPFDPNDLSSIGESIVFFGAAPGTPIFTAPMTSEEFTFTAWSAEGEELYTVTNDHFQRVQKTQEEIDLETELVNARMVQQGMPPEMANWEPEPYRLAIAGLSPDGMGRLWVTRGTTLTPTFDVYDMEGNLLFTAALDAGESASTWAVIIGADRFLAFDANPEDYPRLYIGDLPR
jgi:hypothetical protein